MNSSKPRAEAIAVKTNKIIKVGTNQEIAALIGKKTQTIQLKRRTVIPGLIDTHIHVADFGKLLTWIDFSDTQSITQMKHVLNNRVKEKEKGKWILGRCFDHTAFVEKRLPTRFDLDLVAPNNPVVFYHNCGQLCVVNSKALEFAGITKQTVPTSGGTIDKDPETGELTGVLRENATNLIWSVIPELNEDELVEAVSLACEKIVEVGVTTVHWIVLSPMEISIIQKLFAQNRLPFRVYIIVPVDLIGSVEVFGLYDPSVVRFGGAVIYTDGYLAARTAALLQPYSDSPASRGGLLCTQEEMNASALRSFGAGLQLVIHAMGDKAVDAALTTIEQTSKQTTGRDVRNRIEQAALLNEGLIERMKNQKVIVSVQPNVIASEFSVWFAAEHLGFERAGWLFPLKTLISKGIKVIGGSDCPMEPLNPMLGIQAALTREPFPEERITIDEALRIYTIDAAYSSSEEHIKGSIEEGKLADLAVISRDPNEVPPYHIKNIKVEMTIVGGKIVYP